MKWTSSHSECALIRDTDDDAALLGAHCIGEMGGGGELVTEPRNATKLVGLSDIE